MLQQDSFAIEMSGSNFLLGGFSRGPNLKLSRFRSRTNTRNLHNSTEGYITLSFRGMLCRSVPDAGSSRHGQVCLSVSLPPPSSVVSKRKGAIGWLAAAALNPAPAMQDISLSLAPAVQRTRDMRRKYMEHVKIQSTKYYLVLSSSQII